MKTLLAIFLFILSMNTGFAQITISGTVFNDDNTPLIGAIVQQKGSKAGVRSDTNGNYLIEVESTSSILVFSYPGKSQIQIKVENRTTINAILENEIEDLDEEIDYKFSSQASGILVTHRGTNSFKKLAKSTSLSFAPINEENYNTEDYSTIHESGFHNPTNKPLSTFSVDVDRASYSNIRRFINMGQLPPKDAVRIEEMLNYFHYNFPTSTTEEPIEIITELAECPWNKGNKVAMFALQTKNIDKEHLPPSNLVFLIDVSGSMNAVNKLQLVKSSLKMLVNELRAIDKIAIVTYASSASIALQSTNGSEKAKINRTIDELSAGGSTAGGKGLEKAYQIASENYMKSGNNRIILATDGDFNVGQSSDAQMERLVESQRNNNIFISVLGFGMGNYKDNKLETIADKGNGNYAYIDNSQEANKVLIQEFGGTLFTVAIDVKIQVEFNPTNVESYRLIGYENRMLSDENFNDDTKDAGEIGAGHQIIALYEIVPKGVNKQSTSIDDLKYQKPVNTELINSNEIATIKVRYKEPTGDTSKRITQVLNKEMSSITQASSELKFALAVTQFGLILRDSEYKGNSTIESTLELAKQANNAKIANRYSGEFIHLVETAESLGLMLNPDKE